MSKENEIEISELNIKHLNSAANRLRKTADNKSFYSILVAVVGAGILKGIFDGSTTERIVSAGVGSAAIYGAVRLGRSLMDNMDTHSNKIAEIAVEEYKLSRISERPENTLFDQDNLSDED